MAKTAKAKPEVTGFKTWEAAKLIPVDLLVLTDWNANKMTDEMLAKLVEEIREYDFDEPCQIVPIGTGSHAGKFLVIGGEHRYKACVIEGKAEVPCVVKERLTDADEDKLMEYSVRRNHLRGQLDVEKYRALEKRLSGKWQTSAEAARERMLVRDERVRTIKSQHEASIDPDGGAGEEVDLEDGSSGSGDKSKGRSTDGNEARKKAFADRRALLANLKSFVTEVLAESEETVEHGYLFFGHGGSKHLVINEDARLHGLIGEMVEACKANSDKVAEFLVSAITKELPQWQ